MKLHVTCFCGNRFDVEDYATCKCGCMVCKDSIRPFLMPVSNSIKLVEFKDTGNHDRDMFGGPDTDPREIPVYKGFTFSTEYDEGRWDECDTVQIATKLSNSEIKFTWGSYYKDLENLKRMIDEYWAENAKN